MEIQHNRARNPGAYVGAAILIVIGLTALIANLGGEKYAYEAIPFGIGAAFLVAYALTRQYGYLVPGAILTGVGAGVLGASLFNAADGGPYGAIGAGIGFLLIFGVDMLVSRETTRWWPTIPGALMILVGAGAAGQDQEFFRQIQIWSPALLIVLGVLLLVTRVRRT